MFCIISVFDEYSRDDGRRKLSYFF
ncbi:hypothetical protein DLJ53_19250 [Acuticoccus sediminis]|uniref:Uncharacterized protein n=1 Tax=Acuticoccus sediminis TaxID=2184697 RepID=A0A8B2NNW7_9HYPH|nr:hypothetical protein DLJ53_19250 [Acuticoccus sediminis]